MTIPMMSWKGKSLDECEASELRDMLNWLLAGNAAWNDARLNDAESELQRLRAENDRLWSAIGARAR